MANPRHKRPINRRKAIKDLDFRVLSPWKTLDEQGFYKGFPCHRGHVVRDKEKHWCYHCVQMIHSNLCGVDFSLMDYRYRPQLYSFFHETLELTGKTVEDTDSCWLMPEKLSSSRQRFNIESWKNHFHKTKRDYREKAGKIMYTLFYGDIGKMSVTRTCGNKNCLNPLHLISSWNLPSTPKKFDYLYLDLDYGKMASFDARGAAGYEIEHLLKLEHKVKIKPAKEVKEEIEVTTDPLLKTIDWNTLKNNQS